MQWFKIHHGFSSSPKFGLIAAQLQIPKAHIIAIALELLDHASRHDRRGTVMDIDHEEIAFSLGLEVVTVSNALLALRNRGFCNADEIINWEHYQGRVDSTNAERQSRYRANKKQSVTEDESIVTVRNALCNTDKIRVDKNKEREEEVSSLPAARKSKNSISFNEEENKFSVSEQKMQIWREAFPAIDIDQQIKAAGSWLIDNPKNKKSNYARFLNNWFTKSQDRAPSSKPTAGQARLSFSEEREQKNQQIIAEGVSKYAPAETQSN